jgi:hypothetical protein
MACVAGIHSFTPCVETKIQHGILLDGMSVKMLMALDFLVLILHCMCVPNNTMYGCLHVLCRRLIDYQKRVGWNTHKNDRHSLKNH